MGIRRKLIGSLVNDLLDKNEIDEAPINVEKIAQKLKLKVLYQSLKGDLSGCIIREDDHAVIGVNSFHSETRQRFTIAHELGHFLLHEGEEVFVDHSFRINRRDGISKTTQKPEEIEANIFAAQLLMPKRLLIKELSDGELDLTDDDQIAKLAQKYKVSQQALSYRLANLGFLRLS